MKWALPVGKVVKPCFNSFSPSTPVHTLSGLVAIGILTIGTPVLAFNEQTGENGYYPITDVHKNIDPAITYLTIQDPEQGNKTEFIETTPEHPFYLAKNVDASKRPTPEGHADLNVNWVGAGHLKLGDRIKQADGTLGTITNVITLQHTQEMFNLTVSEAHTYYVGQDGWLVHNQRNVPGYGPVRPGPYLIDTGVLIQAQRGDAAAIQLLNGNFVTKDVVREFLNVSTNAQRLQLKGLLNSSGIIVMDGQTAKALSSSSDFQKG